MSAPQTTISAGASPCDARVAPEVAGLDLRRRDLVGKPAGEGLFDLAPTLGGGHACVFCGVCAKRCPVSCITVHRAARTSADKALGLFSGSITVDEERCIACGDCVRACALNALVPTAHLEKLRAAWHESARQPAKLSNGHGMCSGCTAPAVVHQVLAGVGEHHHVVAGATGCLEVSTTRYPYTSWQGSYIHTAFENAAATLSGVESAYRALRRRGRLDERVKFIAFGGDGGTYDIGLQSLSGAMERGHDMLYVCYDNGAYMNTGFQRSSATPFGAWTSTSPIGEDHPGKVQQRKNLTEIMVAHRLPYIAQASPHDPRDLMRKAAKALSIDGPTFLNVISPCPRGWRTESAEGIGLARLAADVCYWPLYEVEGRRYTLNYRPRDKKPLAEWLERQGRFLHLAHPDAQPLLVDFQRWIDEEWDYLLRLCGELPEAEFQTTSKRHHEEPGHLHPHHIPLPLGEPLSASMTDHPIRWADGQSTASGMGWGAFED